VTTLHMVYLNIIVIFLFTPSQLTEHPRASAINLNGNIVRLFIIWGTTFESDESIGFITPLTLAIFFPIHSSIVFESKAIVTLFSMESQLILPPSASIIGLIGTNVLLFKTTGDDSRYLFSPFTKNVNFPI